MTANKVFKSLGIDIKDGKLSRVRDILKDINSGDFRHPDKNDWIIYDTLFTYVWDPWEHLFRLYIRGVGFLDDTKIVFTDRGEVYNFILKGMREDSEYVHKLIELAVNIKNGEISISDLHTIKRPIAKTITKRQSNWDNF